MYQVKFFVTSFLDSKFQEQINNWLSEKGETIQIITTNFNESKSRNTTFVITYKVVGATLAIADQISYHENN